MIHFISNNFVDYVLIIIFDIIVALIFFLFIPKLLRLWIRFWEQIDEKELGEEHGERIGLYPAKPSNAPVPTPPIIHDRVLPIWLCKDESGLSHSPCGSVD